ncbi:YggS family pyridoxal phosphate-dependent enzyme [Halorhodospira abdelmalekii]|uniref:YggS family pyridoxal phosphate-dependent enzyme n=1 Tax=Halorhodospira abdelmalekii TaxID=421629 RepID=UPI0019049EE0|nr:YggS family pyridoxal phosphate-dependent enzyme [Halorhodospira abdelmalekii]MBK1735272.1 YggS family pyridoxal phosphate-dependent enzyme [Halorhodospira abdelmalekii]
MSDITARLAEVEARIRRAEAEYGRTPHSVRLLAVSKRQPIAALRAAYDAGQRDFGENYLQEAERKQAALPEANITWHLIGALQSNKTREAATRFHWIHTLDRSKIARRLAEQRPESLEPLNICLQVNISAEPQKAGCLPEAVHELADCVAQLPRLRLRGLMALPAPATDPVAQRRPFALLRELFDELRRSGFPLDTLSMGMSADLEAAIAEGANIVRVGTALFGPRPNHPPSQGTPQTQEEA